MGQKDKTTPIIKVLSIIINIEMEITKIIINKRMLITKKINTPHEIITSIIKLIANKYETKTIVNNIT